jgi:hypothetical protein
MDKQPQTISFELAEKLKYKFIKNAPQQPQTISFELAKKIDYQFKKLKDSYFYWYKDNTINPETNPTTFHSAILDIEAADEIYPAYQLHEILEMLPPYIDETYNNFSLSSYKFEEYKKFLQIVIQPKQPEIFCFGVLKMVTLKLRS